MILDWILNSVPWWVQLAVVGAILAPIVIIVGNIVGWDKVRRWIVPLAIALGAGAALSRARQQGIAAEKARQKKADEKVAETIEEIRTETHASSDEELNKKVDEWTRK